MVLIPLVPFIVASACSKPAPPSQATAPNPSRSQLAPTSGVDPRAPEQVLPIAPVVAPFRLPVKSAVGSAVTTVFQARPNTSCQMQVDYPSGRRQALPPKATDDAGHVGWTWVPLERGHVVTRIVCSGGQMTQATIRVV